MGSVRRSVRGYRTMLAVCLMVSAPPLTCPLAAQQMEEGNYKIRFEPTAKLQTGTRVPFEVKVTDDRLQPLADAKVVLTCTEVQSGEEFEAEARATTTGVYLAKTTFPQTGTWRIRTLVTRNNKRSSRVILFNVAE